MLRKNWSVIQEVTKFYIFPCPWEEENNPLAALARISTREIPEEILTEAVDDRSLESKYQRNGIDGSEKSAIKD